MTNEIINTTDLISLAAGNMPKENSFQRLLLPRLGMFSQDQTEGKGKAMKVVSEAGTFYIERETEDVNEHGKKVWVKEEIGPELEATIIYYRKQLSMYDSATEKYTNSPIYDTDTDIIPLFCDKKEVAKGTQAELKTLFRFTDPKDGKVKSKLQDNKILYVLYDGDIYQLSVKGTSMFSFATYIRGAIPSTVLTTFSSEAKTQGVTNWNMMTFKTKRKLTEDELRTVINHQTDIKNGILAEKQYFAEQNVSVTEEEGGYQVPDVKVIALEDKDF